MTFSELELEFGKTINYSISERIQKQVFYGNTLYLTLNLPKNSSFAAEFPNPKEMFYRARVVIFLMAAILSGKLNGQSSSTSGQLWTDFNYQYFPKSRLAIGGQTGLRTDIGSPDWNSFYFLPEVDYRIDKHFEIAGGIGVFQNWNNPASNRFETRFTQEATANWPQFKNLVFSNRLKVDERFTTYKDDSESTESTVNEWTFRLRYRLRAKSEYFNLNEKIKNLYVVAYAEYFIPIEEKRAERFANRTRFALGFGQIIPKNQHYEVNIILQESVNNIESGTKSDQIILRLRYYLKTLSF